MKYIACLLGAVGAAWLSGCCHQGPLATNSRASHGKHFHWSRTLSDSGRRPLSIPERVHAYDVGRLPSHDGRSIHEAGTWYHVEESAYGNRFVPGSHAVIVTRGPTEQVAVRAYRPVPNDPQVTELRNEALEEKGGRQTRSARSNLPRRSWALRRKTRRRSTRSSPRP
jgi:hypothetical protein